MGHNSALYESYFKSPNLQSNLLRIPSYLTSKASSSSMVESAYEGTAYKSNATATRPILRHEILASGTE